MKKELEISWYQELVEECKAIITEAVFTSRWALVEGYWKLGERISEENDNFKREKIYGEKIVQDLAISLNTSSRTLHYAIQVYKKYHKLSEIPEGKNISWNKLITQYLPEPKAENPIPLPEGEFNVIYCDPAWEYSNSGFEMSAEKKYPTISIEKLKELEVLNLGAKNSIMFMWATNPLLKDAIGVMESWGFEYKTNFVWVKKKHTAGFYVFGQHELLLIGVKGSMLPTGDKPKSIIQGDNSIHSKKPEIVYEIIESMFPNMKYVELFARNKRKNWESWGNETEKYEK